SPNETTTARQSAPLTRKVHHRRCVWDQRVPANLPSYTADMQKPSLQNWSNSSRRAVRGVCQLRRGWCIAQARTTLSTPINLRGSSQRKSAVVSRLANLRNMIGGCNLHQIVMD